MTGCLTLSWRCSQCEHCSSCEQWPSSDPRIRIDSKADRRIHFGTALALFQGEENEHDRTK